jgi:hypothetical protein
MDPLGIAVAIGVVGGAVGALVIFWKATRRLFAFLDEVAGEPAQFGRPAKPGLIEKVDGIALATGGVVTTQDAMKVTQDEHTTQIQTLTGQMRNILHELYPNGGGSLRDAVDRLERQIAPPGVQVTINSEHPST